MKEETFNTIIMIVAVVCIVVFVMSIAIYAEVQQYTENNCIKKNLNSDGSYDYNKIIKCCQDEANLNPSYCLEKYKPGYEEKK